MLPTLWDFINNFSRNNSALIILTVKWIKHNRLFALAKFVIKPLFCLENLLHRKNAIYIYF